MDAMCLKCGIIPNCNETTIRGGICGECRWRDCVTCKVCGGEQLANQAKCNKCKIEHIAIKRENRWDKRDRLKLEKEERRLKRNSPKVNKVFINGINIKSKLTQIRKRHVDKAFRGEFDITMEYLTKSLSGQCVFCGRKPTGLDRINSRIGYTQENCQPACGTCNRMKLDMSDDEFIEHVQIMANYFANKNNYA